MLQKQKRYTFQMRVEQEVHEAIEYLKNCGYSVPFKLKLYLINWYEKEKLNNELVS